jgi:hypothetical protein
VTHINVRPPQGRRTLTKLQLGGLRAAFSFLKTAESMLRMGNNICTLPHASRFFALTHASTSLNALGINPSGVWESFPRSIRGS